MKDRVNTIFGSICRREYEFNASGPCPRLLNLAINMKSGNEVKLIKLTEAKRYSYSESKLDALLEKMTNELTNGFYEYELNGIPIANILVPNLLTWAIHLYGDRVIINPSLNVIFSINNAA